MDEAFDGYSIELTPRNGDLSAAELLGFIDREFSIGTVLTRGIEDCIPCAIPGAMVRKIGFVDAFANCGGLRAAILSSGSLAIGDAARVHPG